MASSVASVDNRPSTTASAGHPVWAYLAMVALPGILLLDMAVAVRRGWPVQSRIDLGLFTLAGGIVAAATCLALLPAGRRFYRRYWAQLCLLAIATCLAVAAAEAGLALYFKFVGEPLHRRSPNMHLRYRPKPGIMPGVEGESNFTTNALGIRGPELSSKRDEYRILCLGGSSTACTYLDDAEAWPQLLMDQLNNADGKRAYWVGNAGIPAYRTQEHLEFVEQSDLMPKIDCLLVQAGINDFMSALAPERPEPLVWYHSQLRNLLRRMVRKYAETSDVVVEDTAGSVYPRRRALRQAATISAELPDLTAPLHDFDTRVRAIIEQCRSLGTRVVFTSQPVLWSDTLAPDVSGRLWFGEMSGGRYLSPAAMRAGMDQFNRVLETACRDTSVEFIDLSSMNGHPEWFYDDCHFSEAGAREVSQRIAGWFRERPVAERRAGRTGPMTAILGISAFYHDSAAALVVDGEIVAAAQEERFTRRKHDAGFPAQAIAYCLAEAKLAPEQLDYVGFYDKPLLKFERLLETYLAYAPRGFRSFLQAMPLWLRQKLYLPREMNRGLGGRFRKRFVFTEHHESHAASAFFPSPFEEAAILTLDGVGEWATASLGYGRGNRITLTHELRFPHSLGLLYSAFTYFCGFKVNSGEYKLMGLAPYGQPKYADLILERLIDLKPDGSFRMDMRYFDYCAGLTMTSHEFDRLFGGPPRPAESPITQREMDLAASIQQVTEEIMLRAARHVHQLTGMKNLCLAGGVALNCVGNGRILREGPFDDLWIQPAAGDAGGALGTALFIWHQLLENPRHAQPLDSQHGSLLGPRADEREIAAFLDQAGAKYHRYESDDELCAAVADLLASEKVVGWVQDRMEFGPRALGARSILGDARSPQMQSLMNLKIKFRESFRPFAPSVLQDRAAEYFEVRPGQQSPYMLLVAPVQAAKRVLENGQASLTGIDKLKLRRSEIPAVTHVDHSARVQTVDRQRHARYHRLLETFAARTGCPVIINTSFNVRGEPIVCTPQQAYRCFLATNMDALVLERFVLLKEAQPTAAQHETEKYLAEFSLD